MRNFRYILRYYIDPGYDEDTRIDELVEFCKEATIDDVMLFFNAEEVNNGHITREELLPWMAMAKKIKARLAEIGVTMSVNPWTTTVHTPRGRKLKPGQNFTLMVGENGNTNGVTTCPMCEKWLEYICDLWSWVAKELQPTAIWVEDDWRLHNHGRILGWGGCFCEKHLAAFSEKVGKTVSREELKSKVYAAGEVHPWRKIWLDINGEVMSGRLAVIRKAVQQASPGTRIGLMCGTVDTNSMEGINWQMLQDAAGFDPSFLVRPTLYPYTEIWSMQQYPVAARLIVAALKRPIESCPELETGPRHGAYSKGNSFAGWEIEQCAAIGAQSITINHFDMLGCGTSTAPGFAAMLAQKRPRIDAVRQLALDDNNSLGADVLFSPDNAKFFRMRKNGITALRNYSDEWGRVATILGFSFRFTSRVENSGRAVLVSGQTLNAFSDEEVKKLLSGRVILDGFAAEGLIARGFGEYLGLSSAVLHYHNVSAYSYEEIPENDEKVYGVKNPRLTIQRACRQLYEFTPASDEVKVFSTIRRYDHKEMFPGVLCFDNALGGRVMSLSYPLGDYGDSEWFYMGFFNPFRRDFMHKLLRFVAPDMAIACAEKYPFQMHRVKYDGGEYFAAINSASDSAPMVKIAVSDMPEGKLEKLNADGSWETDEALHTGESCGNVTEVIYEKEVPALQTLMFRCVK